MIDSAFFSYDGTVIHSKHVNTYDADVLIQSDYYEAANNVMYESRKFAYADNNTKLVADSIFSVQSGLLTLTRLFVYNYDGNGNIDTVWNYSIQGAVPVLEELGVLAYDQNNRVVASANYGLDGATNAMELQHTDTFSYHSTSPSYATFAFYEYDQGVLDFSVEAVVQLGSNGLPDTINAEVSDAGVSQGTMSLAFEYNNMNNPVRMSQIFMGMTMGELQMYYEDYNDGVSVEGVTFSELFSVSPNPAGDWFVLRSGQEYSGAATLTMTDLSGRCLMQQQHKLSKAGNTIDISGLPNGFYLLNVSHPSFGTVTKKMIKK